MASRRVPIRPTPAIPSGISANGPIDFKNLTRGSALDVRQISEVTSSSIYNLCRTKANQVMMMKHRGYEIPPEETVWLQCSLDENALIQQIRTMLSMKTNEMIRKVFNKTYVLNRSVIPSQTAYTYYPYLENEGDEELQVGEFGFSNGRWELLRLENELTEQRSATTEVIFSDTLNSSNLEVTTTFAAVSRKIIIHIGNEDSFRKELDNMVLYRRQGTEIFHMSELFVDYFQHWLVPHQEIVRDVDKIRLLSSHLMIRDSRGVYQKVPNCKIVESGLPYIHHTDIVVRYMGALPGDVIYWENESYISSFVTKEFGYMLVVGHKYTTSSRAEDATFAGERLRTLEDGEDLDHNDQDDIDEDMDDQMVEDEEDDMAGGEDED